MLSVKAKNHNTTRPLLVSDLRSLASNFQKSKHSETEGIDQSTEIFNRKLQEIDQELAKEDKLQGFYARTIDFFKKYAVIVDSRESVYRAALEVLSFDIPTILAAATRNFDSFAEAVFEGVIGGTMFIFSPKITSTMAHIVGKFTLPKEEHKDISYLLKFQMPELRDKESFDKALERIMDEEPHDQLRVAKLYASLGNEKRVEEYKEKAHKLKDYFENLEYSEELKNKIHKLKKAAIVAESALEGGFFGEFGFFLRLFRKYVLRQKRFTGTKAYLSDAKSKKLGEAGELKTLQKLGCLCMSALPAVMNSKLLDITKDKERVKKSGFLQTIEKHIDMTHGVFPKLGLMFSYTSLPKWLSTFITAQGFDEFIERLAKFIIIQPSWWLGHKATNGGFAKVEDRRLAKKYNVDEGILVEPDDVGKTFAEPARIHHVLKQTDHNPELQKEAIDAHAKVLYKGFSLHSLAMFGIFLGINFMTKFRVMNKAKQLAKSAK